MYRFMSFFGVLASCLLFVVLPTRAVTNCDDYGKIYFDKYFLFNNVWNANLRMPGSWQCIWNDSNTAWGTNFNYPENVNNGSIKTWQSIVMGWQWGLWSNNSGLPIQLSANQNVYVDWTYAVQNPVGRFNVAFDLWIHNTNNPQGNTNPTTEVMIWPYTSQSGFNPAGSYQTNVNIGGHTWEVWRETNHTWQIVSYKRTSNLTGQFNVNLKNFTDDMRNRGWQDANHYLTSIQAGVEVVWGSATVPSSYYNVRINGTSGGGSSQPVANGTYRVISRHSGKAMDVSGVSTSDGAQIHQWDYVGGNNQKWYFEYQSDGYYEIKPQHVSGKNLDISSGGTANGTKVQQWSDNNSNAQRFKVEALSGGYYRITPKVNLGSCLDVEGVSTSNGAKIHEWQWFGANNQQWQILAP